MCGILVAKRPSEERVLSIAHRGIEHSVVYKDDLCLVHHSLGKCSLSLQCQFDSYVRLLQRV
jgi:hypothetical protein